MTQPENPYLGLRPFAIQDASQFFGRRREADDLVSSIYADAVVLVYAPSGAGKSSLLNAAVIPRLREDFDILPSVRISFPLESARSVTKSYIVSTLAGWAAANEDQTASSLPLDVSLSDFLSRWPRSKNDYGGPKARLIIFDQAEELFKTSSAEAIRAREDFWRQLSEALGNDRD